MENCSAADLYEYLKMLRYQLEQLNEQGRIVMSRDSYNKGRHDSAAATRGALAGLE